MTREERVQPKRGETGKARHGKGPEEPPSGLAVKAIMPAGASSSILPGTKEVLDTPMDYESVAAAGSALGSASVIVMDESVDMAWVLKKKSEFFKHESCGKCTPCREGTYWMLQAIERVEAGGASGDVRLLRSIASGIQGKCLCALGEFSTMPVVKGIDRFSEDFARTGRGPQ